MPKFRSRPATIEATQWFPGVEHPGVRAEASYATIGGRGGGSQTVRQPDNHYVTTIHGQKAYLEPGDWVVTEPDGVHHYPVKPDVFEKRWELVRGYAAGDPPPDRHEHGHLEYSKWCGAQLDGGLTREKCHGCGAWTFPNEPCCEAKHASTAQVAAGVAAH
jgi:hypothetical protein